MGYDMSFVNGVDENEEKNGYFRLNIWGMRWMREIMAEAKAMDCNTPEPAWPKADVLGDDPTDEEYEEFYRPVRSQTSSTGMVPWFKFCSNDGWIVTPDECRVLAARLRDYLAKGGGPALGEDNEGGKYDYIVEDFADYAERAAEHGGFGVY